MIATFLSKSLKVVKRRALPMGIGRVLIAVAVVVLSLFALLKVGIA